MKNEFDLVVNHSFGSYSAGDRITNADEIAKIMGGTNTGKVVKVHPLEQPKELAAVSEEDMPREEPQIVKDAFLKDGPGKRHK